MNLSKNPKLILLDIYGTLLNMDEVEKRVNSLLETKQGYIIWMDLFMQYCFVDNCIEQFNDFSSIAKATMQMAGDILGKEIDLQEVDTILEILKQVPINEGVQQGLSMLNDLGFRIAALTNAPEIIIRNRMERTGLISYFERILSAEHVKKYKPSILVYNWACQEMKVKPEDVLLVTMHGWDIAGANNAGIQTAYMQQSKRLLYPLTPNPDLSCSSLVELASVLSQPK